MAYLLFMETPHRQRIVFELEGGGADARCSLQQRASPVALHHTDPGVNGYRKWNWCRSGTRGNRWNTGMTITDQLTGVVNFGRERRCVQFAMKTG